MRQPVGSSCPNTDGQRLFTSALDRHYVVALVALGQDAAPSFEGLRAREPVL